MSHCKTTTNEAESCTTTVNVDVTKIVKYSCISSVLIVFIVFCASTLKHIFSK